MNQGEAVTQRLLAHYDGQVLVPDEPVDLPTAAPLRLEISRLATPEEHPTPDEIRRRVDQIDRLSGSISAPVLPDAALRREAIYEDDV